MTSKPRCLIVTVGASLIDKCNEKYKDYPDKQIIKDIIENLYNNKKSWDKQIDCYRKNKNYEKAYKIISKWLGNKKEDSDKFRKFSAELNSLYHLDPPVRNIDKVILIATRTPVGLLCSDLLKEALEKNNGAANTCNQKLKVCTFYPKGLGKASDDTFVEDGLPNFISELTTQIQKHSKDFEVILIPTGGYKSLIPYSTLAAILHKKDIKYIYEDSDKLISLPSLPVGLDIEKWQPAYLKLEMLTTLPYSSTKGFYENLDNSFKSLLKAPPDEEQSKSYEYNEMGKFLKERYLQLKYQKPLQFQTAGMSLLNYLKRNDGSTDLVEKFSQLAKIGPYFWVGDKVPDMVEHALYHHTNLFEIAELLLLPILNQDNNFLKPEELFILLCTIYFHDWGHIISTVDGINLLPTQIREFHHILGYKRLENKDWQKKLIEMGLQWVEEKESSDKDKIEDKLWDNYLKIIATIGLFHRKDMPLENNGNNIKEYGAPIKKKYSPLENKTEWKLKFEGKCFSNRRAILIASLFRIIDSLDNQVTRMGTDEEIKMKAAVVLNDAENSEKRVRSIRGILKQFLENNNGKGIIGQIEKLLKNLTGKYRQKEKTCQVNERNNTNENKKQKFDLKVEKEKILNSVSDEIKPIIDLYIDSSCWYFFKTEQPKHYLKHLAIKGSKISHQYNEKNGKKSHEITVEFISQDNKILKKYCEIFKLKDEDLPVSQEIINNIKEEYEIVKEILNCNFVEIYYKLMN